VRIRKWTRGALAQLGRINKQDINLATGNTELHSCFVSGSNPRDATRRQRTDHRGTTLGLFPCSLRHSQLPIRECGPDQLPLLPPFGNRSIEQKHLSAGTSRPAIGQKSYAQIRNRVAISAISF